MTKTLLLASVAVFALSAPALAQCCGGVSAPAAKGAILMSKDEPAPAPADGTHKEPEAEADAAAGGHAPAKPAH